MTKSDLRKHYKLKRQSLSKEEFLHRSTLVFSELQNLISTLHPKCIHAYVGIEKFRELNPQNFFQAWQESDIQVLIPRSNFEDCSMETVLWTSELTMACNSYGITEPVGGTLVSPKEIDLILVPLLAHDKDRNRLGYGKGFYDRFLQELKPSCLKLGLSVFPPELQTIPGLKDHDFPLDKIIYPDLNG